MRLRSLIRLPARAPRTADGHAPGDEREGSSVNRDVVTIVSGLPRSGTSMMMRMLEAGGMEVVTDRVRQADEDNPNGYYEFERAKQVKHDQSWLDDAKGKTVKMVSALLADLPNDHGYRVIFMRRRMEEILASQRQMLVRRKQPTDSVGDDKMAGLFEKHLKQVEAWMTQQPNFDVIYVDYNQMLTRPLEHATKVNAFLGNILNTADMAKVVNPALYRQRR
jgi:hypothetical protein